MMESWKTNVCPRCFKSTFANGVCSNCWFRRSNRIKPVNALPEFTVLDGRYMLGTCIGEGGFGITYIALDLSNQAIRAVKEYFPANIAFRVSGMSEVGCSRENARDYEHGLKRFYNEAVTLSTLSGKAGIVEINAYLKANNTAYIVMEYINGENIRAHMQSMGNIYPYPEAERIFREVADTMKYVHRKKLLHRDLTPENILIMPDGHIKIIDFGSARDYIMNATGMSVMVKHGYAPIEQYSAKKPQGPYTDIYSLSCTLYFMLSGRYVPDAFERVNGAEVPRLDSLRRDIPEKFAAMIEKGMSVNPVDRFQSIDYMLAFLGQNEASGDATSPGDMRMPYREETEEKTGFFEKVRQFFSVTENERASVSREAAGLFRTTDIRCDSTGLDFRIGSDGTYTFGRSASQCSAAIGSNSSNISRLHFIIVSQEMGRKIMISDRSSNGCFSMRYGKLVLGKMYDISEGDSVNLANTGVIVKVVRQ